jgi:restriction system-associated AAA family ATPase
MKLIRLKIGNKFRSLPADFELTFADPTQNIENEPICFVGLNGSGKSNVLEAIAEIFEYLDQYFLRYIDLIPNLLEVATIDQFIIEYLLPIEYTTAGWFQNSVVLSGMEFAHIRVKKLSGRAPFFSEIISGEPRNFEIDRESQAMLLPSRIIGYSSGQNELLSIPFKKLNFKYYHSIREEQKNSGYVGYIPPPRLSYMGYEDNALVLLCNYIMQNDDDNEEVRLKTGVASIDSFELFVSSYYRKRDSFRVTPELQRFINFLKDTATEIIFSSETEDRLRFVVTTDLKMKFREQFPDASSFFNALSWLSLLNMNGIPIKRMEGLLSASDSAYIEYRPFDYEPNFKLFSIDNISINKTGLDTAINYKTLSDGEHQFAFIVGLLSIFKAESTLFLLDEPETHFNPTWKYTYQETFKKVTSGVKNQVLLTTHDPVFISGLSKENVLVFRKPDTPLQRIFRPSKDLKGMGVDAILMSEIFGFDTAVDFDTKKHLIEFRELSIKRTQDGLTVEEQNRYKNLYELLKGIDFAEPLNDPLYREYISSFDNLELFKKEFLTEEEQLERKRISEEIVIKIRARLQS